MQTEHHALCEIVAGQRKKSSSLAVTQEKRTTTSGLCGFCFKCFTEDFVLLYLSSKMLGDGRWTILFCTHLHLFLQQNKFLNDHLFLVYGSNPKVPVSCELWRKIPSSVRVKVLSLWGVSIIALLVDNLSEGKNVFIVLLARFRFIYIV